MTKGVPVTTAIQKELGVEELAWNNDDVYLAEDLMEMTGQEIAQGSHCPSLRPPRRRRLPSPAIPWEGAMTNTQVTKLAKPVPDCNSFCFPFCLSWLVNWFFMKLLKL